MGCTEGPLLAAAVAHGAPSLEASRVRHVSRLSYPPLMGIQGSKSALIDPPDWTWLVAVSVLGTVGALVGLALARWMRVGRRFLFLRLAAGQAVCWLLLMFHGYSVITQAYGNRSRGSYFAIVAALLLVPWCGTWIALRGATPRARFVHCVALAYLPFLAVAGLLRIYGFLIH